MLRTYAGTLEMFMPEVVFYLQFLDYMVSVQGINANCLKEMSLSWGYLVILENHTTLILFMFLLWLSGKCLGFALLHTYFLLSGFRVIFGGINSSPYSILQYSFFVIPASCN